MSDLRPRPDCGLCGDTGIVSVRECPRHPFTAYACPCSELYEWPCPDGCTPGEVGKDAGDDEGDVFHAPNVPPPAA